jgi:DNA-binding NarL/FixJ family response regulator
MTPERSTVPDEGPLCRWVGEIYRAAADPASWPSVIRSLPEPIRPQICDALRHSSKAPIPRAPRNSGNDTPEISDEHRRLLSILLPHIQRGLDLEKRIAMLKLERDSAAGALDSLNRGMIMTNAKAQILSMNHSAEALIAEKDGLTVRSSVLTTSRPADTSALHELIRQACQGNGHSAVGVMSLPRPSFKKAFLVRVQALTTDSPRNGDQQPVAGIFISDPEQHARVDQEALRRLYGFTRSEAAVVSLLVQGKSLEDAADELCVSFNTVRTHLQRIFQKTETNRQGQLLSLLLNGPAAIQRENA